MNTKFETRNGSVAAPRQRAGDPEISVKYFTNLSRTPRPLASLATHCGPRTSHHPQPQTAKLKPETIPGFSTAQVLEISPTTQPFSSFEAFFTPSFTSKYLIFQTLRKTSRFFMRFISRPAFCLRCLCAFAALRWKQSITSTTTRTRRRDETD